mmetsp:Transcript_5245/g.9630  ORF Transcript_5245/g.9630 Transcript_5245/m.9630 type:complete len:466 (+) Transcript_5245:455-1852(+)
MFAGEVINTTEGRQVLHVLLRAEASDGLSPLVEDVLRVKQQVKAFAHAVRSGEKVGVTGKPLVNTLCIGIGGSYLGPEFVAEALRTEPNAAAQATNRRLRFLANVDPVDFIRATSDLDPEETLVVIISKTFTTAETMMNARKVKQWLLKGIQGHEEAAIIAAHMSAVSTNLQKTAEFGINESSVFGFWDWVGGRYSVTSAVGLLPLYLQYGDVIDEFLAGAREVDQDFLTKANSENAKTSIPIVLGLIGWWNTQYLNYSSRAVLPYSQALVRFAAHVQQLDMESNGKQCTSSGEPISVSGPIVFGEPGTNGQHSFYQLLHQGRTVPAEFIGFCRSHSFDTEAHVELMCNFFAQADALALGKSVADLQAESCPAALLAHKSFTGDRPSLSLLFTELSPKACGQLLAFYEHRVAVEGFLWGINSFDQYGVELGKVLAQGVKKVLASKDLTGQVSETLLGHFIAHKLN